MMFAERLHQAQTATNGLLCVGLDPDLDKLPADLRADPTAAARLQSAHRRCDTRTSPPPTNRKSRSTARLGRRTSSPRASATSASARPRAGDPRREAQRHRQYRAGLRARRPSSATAPTPSRSIPTWARIRCCPFSRGPSAARSCCAAPRIPGPGIFRICSSTGVPLYRRVAERAAAQWNQHQNLMLVVGATYPEEMAELRRAHPALWFLVPGIGAQGGDLDSTLAAGLNTRGRRPADQFLARHHLCGRRESLRPSAARPRRCARRSTGAAERGRARADQVAGGAMVRAFTRAVAILEYERPKEIRSLPAALASDRAASARP